MSLITATEVKKYSNLKSTFPITLLCNKKWERAAFKDCLGWVFYDLLEADKLAYDSITWDEDLTLEGDKYYLYDGTVYLYKNLETITGIDRPNCSTNWTIPPRFSNECYEKMWQNGLRDYLANYIHFRVMPFAKEELYEEFDIKVFQSDRQAVKNEAAECLEALKCWIEENHSTTDSTLCDFSEVEMVKEACGDCEDEIIGSNTRIAFKM